MQWRGRRQSDNVDDRRGLKTAGTVGGGGLILALIYALLGGDPRVILDGMQTETEGGSGRQESSEPGSAQTAGSGSDEQREFVAVVLADTEDVWRETFSATGRQYKDPKLVLFNGRVNTACGGASSAVGPFYCPADQEVYLDLDFFATLSRDLGAKGDFARAYVIAHEVGHHVQNLLGISRYAAEQRQKLSEAAYNRLSVKVELQADCLAGVWAQRTHQKKNVLEAGDQEEAIAAAAAVGDDALQSRGQGEVVPDSFTHGSSEQRMKWFSRGFARGDMDECDTFQSDSEVAGRE